MRMTVLVCLLALPASGYAKRGKARSKAKASPTEIRGTVLWEGAAPERKQIDTSTEAGCQSNEVLTETTVVSKNGGLRDVLVRVRDSNAPAGTPRENTVHVYQKSCTYSPRVVGIAEGQTLQIHNQDGFTHNVHAKLGGESWFNRAQPKGAPPLKQQDYGEAGQVLELGCDIHPWMKAFVPVSNHPFFAVTDASGSFAISGLPKGKEYEIEAWHPIHGLKRAKVAVGSTHTFRFQ